MRRSLTEYLKTLLIIKIPLYFTLNLDNHFPAKAQQYRTFVDKFKDAKTGIERVYDSVAPIMLAAARLPIAVSVEAGNLQNTTSTEGQVQTPGNALNIG